MKKELAFDIPYQVFSVRDDTLNTTEEHNVFVLPAKGNQVLSAVCPHEGCEVAWDGNANRFSCPCHESFFGADGSRISGPSPRGLDPLPMRVQDGKLQVQYVSQEQTTRT